MQWFVRAFDRATDEMVEELAMRPPDLDEFRRLFGLQPDDPIVDSYPVGEEQAAFLSQYVSAPLELSLRDYFVEQNTVRAEREAASLLRYASGNADAPDDPFGRCTLEIADDGVVRLTNRKAGRSRAWSGTLATGVVQEVRAAVAELGSAGLPDRTTFPPGATFRELDVGSGVRHQIYWHDGTALTVFILLDGLITEMSHGKLKIGRVAAPRLLGASNVVHDWEPPDPRSQ